MYMLNKVKMVEEVRRKTAFKNDVILGLRLWKFLILAKPF